jgi:hypothetical protein
MRFPVALAFALIIAGACHESAPVSREQVGGVYVVRSGSVVDTLEIGKEGTFKHRLWDESGLAFAEAGRWTMSKYPDGDVAVEFDRITPIADRPSPHRSAPGIWLARLARNDADAVTIMLNRDLDLSYIRQNSSH